MDPKPYLDYLDKEMTIMGILSAFSVAAPAAILGTILSKDAGLCARFWETQQAFVAGGSVLCVGAAFLFYKERSDLAWFFGQISLTEALGGQQSAVSKEIKQFLLMADSWKTWLPYCLAFTFLGVAFAEYFLAMFFFLAPSHWVWLSKHLHQMRALWFVLCPLILIATCIVQSYVRIHYKFHEHAWLDSARDFLRVLSSKPKIKRRTMEDS